jgi:hypothetical protein
MLTKRSKLKNKAHHMILFVYVHLQCKAVPETSLGENQIGRISTVYFIDFYITVFVATNICSLLNF